MPVSDSRAHLQDELSEPTLGNTAYPWGACLNWEPMRPGQPPSTGPTRVNHRPRRGILFSAITWSNCSLRTFSSCPPQAFAGCLFLQFWLIIAAAQRLGCRAVLLVGGNSFHEPLPPGIVAFSYAPFSKIFPRAAVIVHQGGIGTCAQALAAGRPMLVVPFAFDQPDNAARLQRLGVARAIPRKHYTAQRAYSELQSLLSDPAYAARAVEVAHKIAEENGVRVACDAIENHPLAR